MDIDIIRDLKLGAGAGTRSTRVCMSAMSHVSVTSPVFPLYPVLNSLGYCFVCSSTPWLRCGFRRRPRWTPANSITAVRSWATCSTSETWCWGEREHHHRFGQIPVLAIEDTLNLNRFDFANSNINDEHLNKMNPHHIPDVVRIVSRSSSSVLPSRGKSTATAAPVSFLKNKTILPKVLIKKGYDRVRRAKRRNWKLQEMARDHDGTDTDDER